MCIFKSFLLLFTTTKVMHTFEEAEFLEAAQEIDNIQLDGWELLTSVKAEGTECTIYRRYKEVFFNFSQFY